MTTKQRPRPKGVPSGATWMPAGFWTLVDSRTRIGRRWNDKGRVICEWTVDASGRMHGTMRSWYGTGQLESELPFVDGKPSGIQTCFAAKRGATKDATLKACPKVSSLQRTWIRGVPRDEKYFDARGDRVDAEGRSLREAGAARKSARDVARRFRAKRGETFDEALERARSWAQALREAGHDVANEPMPTLAKAPTRSALEKIERGLGGRLPESHRAFLLRYGAVKLVSGQTTAPASLLASARGLQRTLATMLADLRGSGVRLPRPTPWSKWTAKARLLPAAELTSKRWLMIAEEGHRVFAMAPHLDADAPVFEIYTDDALWLSRVGTFDTFISQCVDERIAATTQRLG